MAVDDQHGEQRLVAYIVPKEQPPPTVGELRRAISEQLPAYMVPSAFVFLTEVPQLPNGKVDYQALPALPLERPALREISMAPRTPFEDSLAKIWNEVLGLDQVGIYDDFMELGGDSLRATQVISRVIDLFQVEVPLKVLLEAPTIADMAVTILQYLAKDADPQDIDRMLAELNANSD